ncbi:hypothetical protein EDF58_11217 [Novosphingobium sp. PhB57]|uniref:hypothetical protein n=1 Tax=unclassified Novosphingobium TaxID=2644732 RepID=UPI0010D37F10|nr:MULTISPECIES: hypothetical protein [unclassified Novosphingobium]TCU52973.1 hypothetical protein EDF58_11217 [Novosphingobium sp. PhB57]TDW59204.1 hypothetical protein EDF57_11543 [Novosphingobium sp. PhB55]
MSGRIGGIGLWMAAALALAIGLILLDARTSSHRKVESAEATPGTVIVRVIGPALL